MRRRRGRAEGVLTTLASPCRQKGFFFFWVIMTHFTSPMITRPKDVTATISPMRREMSPVLSPSAGGVGTITNRREVLGAVRGPGVGSTCWDSVDAGWDVGAGRGAILRVGGTDAQTASMVALPGMATEPQIRWGLQTSVDDVVSENVPGPQGAHATFDVAVPGLVTPKPGRHLCRGAHSRHPFCLFNVQYQPGLQVQTRFCSGVQA